LTQVNLLERLTAVNRSIAGFYQLIGFRAVLFSLPRAISSIPDFVGRRP
jgi:hypothetical protein